VTCADQLLNANRTDVAGSARDQDFHLPGKGDLLL